MNFAQGRRGKNLSLRPGSDVEAMLNIRRRILRRKRTQAPADRHTLPQLPERVRVEFRLEFRLPHQDDLNQFRRGGFQVGKQSNLFKGLDRKVLSLVNNQDHSAIATVAIQEEGVQGRKQLAPGAPLGDQAKLLADGLEKFEVVVARVEEDRDFAVGFDPFEQAPTQGRLSGPHFTRQHDKPLALLKSVDEMRKGLPMGVREVKEGWIRGE